VIEVGGFGESVAIIPLPTGIVGDDGFAVGVYALFPSVGGWKESDEEEGSYVKNYIFGHNERGCRLL